MHPQRSSKAKNKNKCNYRLGCYRVSQSHLTYYIALKKQFFPNQDMANHKQDPPYPPRGPKASLEITPFSSVSTPVKAFSYSSILPSNKKPSSAQCQSQHPSGESAASSLRTPETWGGGPMTHPVQGCMVALIRGIRGITVQAKRIGARRQRHQSVCSSEAT